MASVNNGPSSTNTANTQAALTPVNAGLPVPQASQAFRLIGVAKGVNANAVGDTAIPIINASNWTVGSVLLTNASISLTTAAAGIFTAPAAGGSAIRTNAALSALTGPTVTNIAAPAAGTSTRNSTEQVVYFNVATAQGAAATLDVYLYGYDLSAFTP